MDNKNTIVVSIKNAEEMRALGFLLAKDFVKPLRDHGDNLVCCAYAPKNSGKTSLHRGMQEILGFDPWVSLDFGIPYIKDSKWFEWFAPQDDFAPMDKANSTGKMHYVEHATLAHLRHADVSLAISKPGTKDPDYYKDVARYLKDSTVKTYLKNYQPDLTPEELRKLNATIELLEGADKDTREATLEDERTIRVRLLSNNPEIQKLFEEARKNIASNFKAGNPRQNDLAHKRDFSALPVPEPEPSSTSETQEKSARTGLFRRLFLKPLENAK